MAEMKYQIRREGSHFKLSFPEEEPPTRPSKTKKYKPSIWSKIGTFFDITFNIIIMVFGFLIATPFFILNVLWNWIVMLIGLSIFWSLVGIVYYGMILNIEVTTHVIFNNTSLSILLLISFIGAIMATISKIRE
ncbi:hypothetical protein D8861_02760 [Streptococcus sanguinis]|jgi:hypothetical protein|uniref:lactose transporter n=1 Tax=Streptococcus sanguinis TaxID=1305 RepID=UPI000F67342D|nr:lactose transporter [Streptococcus sanguinis]RSI47304.1 hypothetical protein D8873_02760 [Streptococcus sanguinis]RSI68544.1 hypothetical protein D8861_02760 [Streptococcus sanguinis]